MDEELRKKYVRNGALPIFLFLMARIAFKDFFHEYFSLTMFFMLILILNLLFMMNKAHQIRKYPEGTITLVKILLLIFLILGISIHLI